MIQVWLQNRSQFKYNFLPHFDKLSAPTHLITCMLASHGQILGFCVQLTTFSELGSKAQVLPKLLTVRVLNF